MRKIAPKTEEKKNRNRNQLIVGIILIFVMIFSVLGYSLNSGDNTNEQITYNGFKFTKNSGLWVLDKGNFQFSFSYNPKEVDAISSSLNILDNYTDKPLYVYSESQEALNEVYRNLFYDNKIVQRVQNACPEGKKCSEDIPVKTCDNNFIIIKESNEMAIKQQGNCVFIEGKSENLTQLSDSFLYKIIGIQ